MIIGFDYFKTLTTQWKVLKPIARSIKEEGGQVFVISAVSDQSDVEKYKKAMERFFNDTGFPYTNFYVVIFPKGQEADHIQFLKLEKAQELGVEIFFDDRRDVVELFAQSGIPAFQVVNYFPKTGIDNGDET